MRAEFLSLSYHDDLGDRTITDFWIKEAEDIGAFDMIIKIDKIPDPSST